jgi:plasmid stabilization system protein ParE
MARVVITASADADSAAILGEIKSKAGEPTAIKYRTLFKQLYDRLADYPESGPARTVLGTNVRIGIVFLTSSSTNTWRVKMS